MNSNKKSMIGIVGGMGPYAGLDLVKKIFDLTDAKSDQDHIPVSMLSVPHQIEDRTKFLLDPTLENPGIAVGEIVQQLAKTGATVIGMPCNTAHSPIIFNEIEKRIPSGIIFVHMIEEVVKWIVEKHPTVKKVGILATTGTIHSNVYHEELIKTGLEPITLDKTEQIEFVDESIYDKSFGIKSCSNPVSDQAIDRLKKGMDALFELGAETIILGCTEIPIAIHESAYKNIPLIDTTKILARALIIKSNPDSLKQ